MSINETPEPPITYETIEVSQQRQEIIGAYVSGSQPVYVTLRIQVASFAQECCNHRPSIVIHCWVAEDDDGMITRDKCSVTSDLYTQLQRSKPCWVRDEALKRNLVSDAVRFNVARHQ